MPDEQKLFLKIARELWKTEFPFLKPVNLLEIPRLPKGSNYLCDAYARVRARFYFVTFDFSPRRHGEFSVGITVSDSSAKSILAPPANAEPDSTQIGSYNIAAFLGRPAFRWELLDVDASVNEFLVSIGGEAIPTPSHVAANTWKAPSYAVPFDQVAHAALEDVTFKLRKFVFPRLDID